jgi:2-alkenal reductase
MKNGKLKYFLGGCGCAVLLVSLIISGVFFGFPLVGQWFLQSPDNGGTQQPFGSTDASTPVTTPTLIQTEVAPAPVGTPIISGTDVTPGLESVSSDFLSQLYENVSTGVVSISVLVNNVGQRGQVAGSGFVFDESGNIVTNNHVVENANLVVVIFQDGSEEIARVVGTDPYSDLAVVKVEQLPDSATPLPLGESNIITTGDWVIAIGNPFGLNSSMSVGIVSAIGRTIPTEGTPFSIPMAIQTDAAINPGNSGGPLLNLEGQVIGVNAQIASGGTQANAGVGFAIPSEIVRRVVPTLIEVGTFQWSWLGVEGTSVNLFIAEANNLSVERGAYIVRTIPGGPADQAGLQGGAEPVTIEGLEVPSGGDVIIEADGIQIQEYADLLAMIAQRKPDTDIDLTIMRDGEQQQITVTLAPRPTN